MQDKICNNKVVDYENLHIEMRTSNVLSNELSFKARKLNHYVQGYQILMVNVCN